MPYLTIKQAAEATGKSEKTIRRLCSSPKSKDYVTTEEGKLLIDANYLQQHYPMSSPVQTPPKTTGQSLDTSTQTNLPNVQPQPIDNLVHKVAMLEQELKLKEELFNRVTQEKDKQLQEKQHQVEILEKSLLMLGEGLKREPAPKPTPATTEQAPEPPKKKRWWHF